GEHHFLQNRLHAQAAAKRFHNGDQLTGTATEATILHAEGQAQYTDLSERAPVLGTVAARLATIRAAPLHAAVVAHERVHRVLEKGLFRSQAELHSIFADGAGPPAVGLCR